MITKAGDLNYRKTVTISIDGSTYALLETLTDRLRINRSALMSASLRSMLSKSDTQILKAVAERNNLLIPDRITS
jgi:predicted AlkP superfamily phosphohydrolase/phosphomutase